MTDRLGGEDAGEAGAILRELVEVRGDSVGVPITTKMRADVFDGQPEDVGTRGAVLRGRGPGDSDGATQHAEEATKRGELVHGRWEDLFKIEDFLFWIFEVGGAGGVLLERSTIILQQS
jgi:hypothetical protein